MLSLLKSNELLKFKLHQKEFEIKAFKETIKKLKEKI